MYMCSLLVMSYLSQVIRAGLERGPVEGYEAEAQVRDCTVLYMCSERVLYCTCVCVMCCTCTGVHCTCTYNYRKCTECVLLLSDMCIVIVTVSGTGVCRAGNEQ